LPQKAVLLDTNNDLITSYKVIQNSVEELIASLQKHKNEKKYYYKIREMDRTEEYKNWSDIERVSRILYMNKCCYNGLYRVNSQGFFNVPFGKYKNPKFCDEINLRAVSSVLKGVKLISGSFDRCLDYAEKDDFIYLDPPYHPLSNTSYFTSYTKDNFGLEDQNHLFEVFKELDRRGCHVLLSNSSSKIILDLYKDFTIGFVDAKRSINSNAKKRGTIKEVLVSNHPFLKMA